MVSGVLSRPWARRTVAALGIAAAVYAMVYVDVLLRARSAFTQAERYMAWNADPAAKKRHFDALYDAEVARLQAQRDGGKIDRIEFDERVELARFERDHNVEESSLKYAYLWYQTCVELFSPPESRWVRMSRERMVRAKELWKAELTAKGIPFEDYMLE